MNVYKPNEIESKWQKTCAPQHNFSEKKQQILWCCNQPNTATCTCCICSAFSMRNKIIYIIVSLYHILPDITRLLHNFFIILPKVSKTLAIGAFVCYNTKISNHYAGRAEKCHKFGV